MGTAESFAFRDDLGARARALSDSEGAIEARRAHAHGMLSGRRRRLPGVASVLLATLALAGGARAAAGDLDPTFGADGKVVTDFGAGDDVAFAVAIQPNGKIVAAGLSAVGGSPTTSRSPATTPTAASIRASAPTARC